MASSRCVALTFLVAASLLICGSFAQERNYTVARGNTLIATDAGGLITDYPLDSRERAFDPLKTLLSGFAQQIRLVPRSANGGRTAYRLQFVLRSSWMEFEADLKNSSASVIFKPDPDQCSNIIDFVVRSDLNPPELRLLCEGPPARIVRYNLALAKLPQPPPSVFIRNEANVQENPKDLIGDLSNMFAMYYDNSTGFEYAITSQTKIVRQQARGAADYSNFESEIFDKTENITTIGYSIDTVNKVFWFAGFGGRVHKVVVNEANFADSTLTTYTIPSVLDVAAVYADTQRGYLYAITRGNASEPTTVFYYNVGMASTQFVLTGNVTGELTDYDAISVAMDPLGIMYIGTTQSPPSIIQIDIANRNYEATFRLGPEAGPQRYMMHDAISNSLYTGSFDIASRISIIRYAAALACEENCYSHGVCQDRRCTCVNGTSDLTARPFTWQQPWCQTKPCDIDDSNGLICGGPIRSIGCNNGTCLCSANYTGALCQTRQCARNCSGAGICNIAGDVYTCSCSEGRGGDDCSLITKLPCHRYDTCSGCFENPSCGWCESGPVQPFNSTNNASRCIEGTRLGPSNGNLGCRSWHFQECPSIAITVGSAIIAALVGIMFAINAMSFIWEDSRSERPAKRIQWYRFQRSSKAYAALWQLQYFAVVTILAATVITYPSPTAFISYTRVWLPVTGVHGFGITGPRNLFLSITSNDTATSTIGQNTQATGVTQALVYADLMESSLMRGVMATWAVLLAIMLGVYLIAYSILALVRGSERFVDVLMKRPLYILLRAVEIGYFPMVVFGAVQLSYRFREPAWAALGGVFYVLIGIVYPVGMTLLVTFIDKKYLFKEEFLLMFYPFYGNMDHKKAVLAILPWAKKFIIGSAFGFGIFSLLGQVVTTLIVCIVYAVAILFLRPYVDYLHQYMDITTSAFTALTTLPLFAFTILDLSPTGILGATLVFVIFNVLSVASCIGFYIYSWCQMKGIFALSQCARCLSCLDDDS